MGTVGVRGLSYVPKVRQVGKVGKLVTKLEDILSTFVDVG